MNSAFFRRTFLRVLQFLKIKERRGNFLGEPILQKVWVTWSPILYFNFKSFMEPSSLSFIRFQCILHGSRVLFLEPWDFHKLKCGRGGGGPNFWGEAILQKVWIIWSPLLYFNFKSFLDANSLSFIILSCILDFSRVLISESYNFFKLRSRDLISGRTNVAESLNYLVLPSVFQF